MHVLVGIAVTLLAFVASKYTSEALAFGGLLNPAALVLLAVGPIGVTMVRATPSRSGAATSRC